MRKIGMAQIKNVLKIVKSKLGRFGQWLDEVYNPWMLRILVVDYCLCNISCAQYHQNFNY